MLISRDYVKDESFEPVIWSKLFERTGSQKWVGLAITNWGQTQEALTLRLSSAYVTLPQPSNEAFTPSSSACPCLRYSCAFKVSFKDYT